MEFKATKDKILERVSGKAGDYEELSVNCAQGTLLALHEEFNLKGNSQDILKAAFFLPGINSRKETCGAVTGALIAFGLAFGRGKLYDQNWKSQKCVDKFLKIKRKVWTFCETFKKTFGGSTMCGDIRPQIMGRDYDSMNPKDRQQFLEDDGPIR